MSRSYYVAGISDPHFTGENATYSRGFLACYRQDGETKWTPCANWIGDGHGSGHMASIWCDTKEKAKEAAKEWLRKRAAKRARRAA